MCLAPVQAPRIQEWTRQSFCSPGVCITIFGPPSTPTPPAHPQVWLKHIIKYLSRIRWLSFWRYRFLEFYLNSKKACQNTQDTHPFLPFLIAMPCRFFISHRPSGTSGSSEEGINLPAEREGLPTHAFPPPLWDFKVQVITPSPA